MAMEKQRLAKRWLSGRAGQTNVGDKLNIRTQGKKTL